MEFRSPARPLRGCNCRSGELDAYKDSAIAMEYGESYITDFEYRRHDYKT